MVTDSHSPHPGDAAKCVPEGTSSCTGKLSDPGSEECWCCFLSQNVKFSSRPHPDFGRQNSHMPHQQGCLQKKKGSPPNYGSSPILHDPCNVFCLLCEAKHLHFCIPKSQDRSQGKFVWFKKYANICPPGTGAIVSSITHPDDYPSLYYPPLSGSGPS